jgi:hypothetical protein
MKYLTAMWSLQAHTKKRNTRMLSLSPETSKMPSFSPETSTLSKMPSAAPSLVPSEK